MRPPPPRPMPPPRQPVAYIVVAVVTSIVFVFGGLYVLRGTVAWSDRGCDLPSAVVNAVIRGEPGTFEYCESADTPQR